MSSICIYNEKWGSDGNRVLWECYYELQLGEWLQQVPGIKSQISVQKSTVLRYCAVLSGVPLGSKCPKKKI